MDVFAWAIDRMQKGRRDTPNNKNSEKEKPSRR